MLKGQTESGEWVEFEVCDIALANKNGAGVYVGDRYVFIDPATIQPADDPRKQMLDEIRRRVVGIVENKRDDIQDAWLFLSDLEKLLREMEAKL